MIFSLDIILSYGKKVAEIITLCDNGYSIIF